VVSRLLAGSVLALGLALVASAALGARPAHAAPAPTTTTAPRATAPTTPKPVVVGPPGATPPTTLAPGAPVKGGKQPSPGLFDITGHIEAAIDSWFRDAVTAALNPVLALMGRTLLATPDVTGQGQVAGLWQVVAGAADSVLVLFVIVGGAVVMAHETLQVRWALKDIAPRVVVAAVFVNASLSLAGLAISSADSLSAALLGEGVGPAQAAAVLQSLVIGSLGNGGIFLVLVGAVVAVLAVVLLATFVIRVALVVLLVVAAPAALVCHALPQTEGLARLWWRAFAGTLAVQVAQSLVLITALRVFLASDGPANLGISSTGGLVDLLVSASLCWVLVKIPVWVGRAVFSGPRRGGAVSRTVRDVVVYKVIRAVAAAAAAG
jgi:hypothetical protein